MAAAAERSTNNDAGFVGEEDEASRVGDLYVALNVETTATSIEVRFFVFSLFFLVLEKANAMTCVRRMMMHLFTCRFAVASLLCHPRKSRRDDAHRERARGGGGGREERERGGEIFSFSKSRIGNERFFQEEEEEGSVGILFELYYGKEMF